MNVTAESTGWNPANVKISPARQCNGSGIGMKIDRSRRTADSIADNDVGETVNRDRATGIGVQSDRAVGRW